MSNQAIQAGNIVGLCNAAESGDISTVKKVVKLHPISSAMLLHYHYAPELQ